MKLVSNQQVTIRIYEETMSYSPVSYVGRGGSGTVGPAGLCVACERRGTTSSCRPQGRHDVNFTMFAAESYILWTAAVSSWVVI